MNNIDVLTRLNAQSVAVLRFVVLIMSCSSTSAVPVRSSYFNNTISTSASAVASTVVSCTSDEPTSYTFTDPQRRINISFIYNPCEDVFYVSGACGVLRLATDQEKAVALGVWLRSERERMKSEMRRLDAERKAGILSQPSLIQL